MCGRYYIKQSEEMEELIRVMNQSSLMRTWNDFPAGVRTYGERFPSDVVPVIASNQRGERSVFPMKWGYDIGKLVINARSETAAEKPMFRTDWARRRCIVPASWYFEWEHERGPNGKMRTRDKYMIQPKGVEMTWLCGIYRMVEGLPHFVILTREPGEEIRFIHDRMPLIMPKELVGEWIRPEVRPEELMDEALTEMVYERA